MKLIKHLAIILTAAAIVSTSHAQEGGDIKARFKELENQARAAKEAGRHDEAQAIMEKAKRMIAGNRDGEQGGDKLEMAKRKIEELRKAGNNEEADQLERRVREAGEKRREGEKFRDGEKERPAEKVRDGDKERPVAKVRDGERGGDERMQHIEQAIKHLRAAGLHEPAERISQMAREQHNKPARPEIERGAAQEQLQRAIRDTQEQTHRALRETHEQMAKMARAIEELREQVAKSRKERD
jgi:hypothetical protein